VTLELAGQLLLQLAARGNVCNKQYRQIQSLSR
jgi:hypothetical protein